MRGGYSSTVLALSSSSKRKLYSENEKEYLTFNFDSVHLHLVSQLCNLESFFDQISASIKQLQIVDLLHSGIEIRSNSIDSSAKSLFINWPWSRRLSSTRIRIARVYTACLEYQFVKSWEDISFLLQKKITPTHFSWIWANTTKWATLDVPECQLQDPQTDLIGFVSLAVCCCFVTWPGSPLTFSLCLDLVSKDFWYVAPIHAWPNHRRTSEENTRFSRAPLG